MSGKRPVTKNEPCPCCDHCDYCCWWGDGERLLCERFEEGKVPPGMKKIAGIGAQATFVWIKDNPRVSRAPKKKASDPKYEGEKLQAKFVAQLQAAKDYQSIDALAAQIGLEVEHVRNAAPGLALASDLKELGAGGKNWKESYPEWVWTFAEVDEHVETCGHGLRTQDGRKGAFSRTKCGARRGVTLMKTPLANLVHVVEGPTDVIACSQMGLSAIGRFSNRGGGSIVAELVPEDLRDSVSVVGENDRKLDGSCPGMDGAINTAQILSDSWKVPVAVAMPPEGFKDCREWVVKHPGEPIKFDFLAATSPGGGEGSGKAKARKANQRAFKNFILEQDPENPEKMRTLGIGIDSLIRNQHDRLLGFPRVLGTRLFDHDLERDELYFINTTADLTSWTSRKTGHNVEWKTGTGLVTKEEFMSALLAESIQYDSASPVPFYPEQESIYVKTKSMPTPDPEMGCFNELINKFSPATPLDATLIRCMFSTPLFYLPGQKPGFVIDSEEGQGVGKSTLARFLSDQFGEKCFPYEYNIEDLKDAGQIRTQLVVDSGEGRFLMIFDNCQGTIKSLELSKMITNPVITGRILYKNGVFSRPNDKTVIITGNNITLERDLAQRCVKVMLTAPESPEPGWQRNTANFLRENRLQIVADQLGAMERSVDKTWLYELPPPLRRFPEWSQNVIGAHCSTQEEYADVGRSLIQRAGEMDGESFEAEDASQALEEVLRKFGLDPDISWAWFSRSALSASCRDKPTKIPFDKWKEWSGVILKELSASFIKYPTTADSKRLRGLFWVPADLRSLGAKPTPLDTVHIIHFSNGVFHLMAPNGREIERSVTV